MLLLRTAASVLENGGGFFKGREMLRVGCGKVNAAESASTRSLDSDDGLTPRSADASRRDARSLSVAAVRLRPPHPRPSCPA